MFIIKRIAILICPVLMLFYSSCNHTEQHKEEEAKFLVTSPWQGDTTIYKTYVC